MAGVVANFDQLAVWSSGMILALGARGPGLNSQNSPILVASSIVTIVLSQHSVHGGTRLGSVQFAYRSEARLAQSAERKALNLVVVGSSPTVGVSLPARSAYPNTTTKSDIWFS